MICEAEDTQDSTPFNDTNQPSEQQSVAKFTLAKQGIDTNPVDPYRQGVSIKTSKHKYIGMQPKIGTNSECHYVDVITFGQQNDFTRDTRSSLFVDKIDFDTVGFMNSPDAYYPILLNEGPQQGKIASLQPLTIPYKSDGTFTSQYEARGFHGNLEDGNPSVILGEGNSRTRQFLDYEPSPVPDFFLDEGSEDIGGILVEGFVPIIKTSLSAYNDTLDEEIVKQVRTTNEEMLAALKLLDYDLSEDIRGSFTQKSAPAGSDVYGPGQSRYGTDSIAYSGTYRGS